ncbi:hypothetical protein HK101_007135, partial [Irineochytrium annulatum]
MVLSHPTITVLHLVDCFGLSSSSSSPSAVHISQVLRQSRTLEQLVLDHNQLGSDGAATVFAGLMDNPGSVLKKFSLRYCDIGVHAAQSIAATLSTNSALAELDLNGNHIGDEGLIPIARSLISNLSLKTLTLAANQITDRDKSFLSTSNPSSIANATITGLLKVLDANSQQVTKSPVTTSLTPVGLLCSALATENNGLSVLDLRGNHIGQRGAECVHEMMKARRQLAAAKKAEPLKVMVTERMSGSMFGNIMDLNGVMDELAK